jgi:hypothetical protein
MQIGGANQGRTLQGGLVAEATFGDIASMALMGASMMFVDRGFKALRYLSHGSALRSALITLAKYARCWNMQGLRGSNKRLSLLESAGQLARVEAEFVRQETQVKKFLQTENALAGRTDNFYTSQLRKQLHLQVTSIKSFVDTVSGLRDDPHSRAPSTMLPDIASLPCCQLTTLPVEHMFADLGRKHQIITEITFGEHWTSMVIETIKRQLHHSVLGYSYPAVQHSYPIVDDAQPWSESVSQQVFGMIIDWRLRSYKERSLRLHNKPLTDDQLKELRLFAQQFPASKQQKIRQSTKLNPGTAPMAAFIDRNLPTLPENQVSSSTTSSSDQ